VVEKQKVISSEYIDSESWLMARSDGEACVQVFFIRGGNLSQGLLFTGGTADTPTQMCSNLSSNNFTPISQCAASACSTNETKKPYHPSMVEPKKPWAAKWKSLFQSKGNSKTWSNGG
jgi:excinuclease UvrABC nuclease subunit